MTTQQDGQFAMWFNRYYGDPNNHRINTRAQIHDKIKHGLKQFRLANDKDSQLHCMDLLNMVGLLRDLGNGKFAIVYSKECGDMA